jgi:chaperonin GroEL
MANKVIQSKEKIREGINEVANAVAATMGAKGRNVLIESGMGMSPHITKDGVTVARSIIFDDLQKDMGASLIKEVAGNTANDAGDGTSLSTVLTQNIFNFGDDAINRGINPVELKKGMDKAVAFSVEQLKKMSKKIKTEKELKNIAYISANNDEALGKIISDVINKVGKDGSITIEKSLTTETSFTTVNGFKIDTGVKHQEFINNTKRNRVEFDNPLLVLYDRTISNIKDVKSLLEKLVEAKQPIVFICEDIDGEFGALLTYNAYANKAPFCFVTAPNYGELRHKIMNDVAMFTGGKYITLNKGMDLNKANISDLGTCEKIIIDKNSTVIIGGGGNKEDFKSYIEVLEAQIESTEDKNEKASIKDRIAKMNNGAAVLKVGAISETELMEKLDRVDDAVCACKASLEEGYIAGGGTTFLAISEMLKTMEYETIDEKEGIAIIRKSIEAPFKRIITNAGLEWIDYINDIKKGSYGLGYNVKTDKLEDLFKSGVIDPTKVARVALENANSVASVLLTTEYVLTYEKPKEV